MKSSCTGVQPVMYPVSHARTSDIFIFPQTSNRGRSESLLSLRRSPRGSLTITSTPLEPDSLRRRRGLLPNMHRRLQSITAWLSPKDSSYSFVPLSSSQANSPDLLGGSAFAPSKPPLSRRFGTPPLLTIWLYISPTLVVVLLLALVFRPAPQDDGVLNPYICKPKAQSSTLAMMCEEDPKTPDWTMKVRAADRPPFFELSSS